MANDAPTVVDWVETERLRSTVMKTAELVRIARLRAERALLTVNEELAIKTEELRKQREWFEVTLSSVGDAVITTDTQGLVTYLNPIAETMTGWLSIDAFGEPIDEIFRIVNEATQRVLSNPIKAVLKTGKNTRLPTHTALIDKNGAQVPIEDSIAPIRDTKGNLLGAVIVFHDVSAARELSLRMSHLAQHDGLTDLPNRILLYDRLTQAMTLAKRRRKKLAVLFLDLDRFKHINDSLGHAIGDRVLQSIAERLRHCVRSTDTVSRQGGDEFVVLLSEVKKIQDAAVCAEKILAALSEPFGIDHHNLYAAASIGIATYPDDGTDADTLLKHADLAMYQAKDGNSNTFRFFERQMTLHVVERQEIESDLRRAIDRDQFVLYYQARVDLITEQIVGVEVLIRWKHPARGLVQPDKFMAIAEESGVVVPLGRWVLREGCRQGRAWLDGGMPEKKEAFLLAQSSRQESLANRVRREVEWLRRGAKARTGKSKARIDEAGRLMRELSDLEARGVKGVTQIDFTGTDRRTKRLVSVEAAGKELGGRRLFRDLSFTLTPGTRLGLLAGELEPDAGAIERAAALRIVYFDQAREQLDTEQTLRQGLGAHGDHVIYRDRPIHVAGWAKRFLFDAGQLDRPISSLSGGEQARVLIARLMLQPADVLLLDEPTNDLDIPTLEVLEESLTEFPGALVLVTHDRYLLDRVSTIVLGLDGRGGAQLFADYWQWEQAQGCDLPN